MHGYAWSFSIMKTLPTPYNIEYVNEDMKQQLSSTLDRQISARECKESPDSLTMKGGPGLYHITWLRETWKGVLIRQFPGISLNLGHVEGNWLRVLDFSEMILLLYICLLIVFLSYSEQVRVFSFWISSHLTNGQCLLKRKRLCIKNICHVHQWHWFSKACSEPDTIWNCVLMQQLFP